MCVKQTTSLVNTWKAKRRGPRWGAQAKKSGTPMSWAHEAPTSRCQLVKAQAIFQTQASTFYPAGRTGFLILGFKKFWLFTCPQSAARGLVHDPHSRGERKREREVNPDPRNAADPTK